MKVKCFGMARDIFETDEIEINNTISTVKDLRIHLNQTNPVLLKMSSYMIAVNHEYAEDGLKLSPTDEIAIIPPVSGG